MSILDWFVLLMSMGGILMYVDAAVQYSKVKDRTLVQCGDGVS